MDNSLTWDQMSLEMRLNCQCDARAKTSVEEQAILRNTEGTHYTTEMLPREHTAIFIGKTKITSDPTKALQYKLNNSRAKEFLTEEGG